MSIKLVVTAGFGNGTFTGSIGKVVTRGYNISTIIPPTVPTATGIQSSGELGEGIASTSNLGDGLVGQGNL